MTDDRFIPEGRPVPAGHGWRWIADGWAFTGRQRGTFIGLFVLVVVLLVVVNLIPLLGGVAGALLMPGLLGGLWLGCDAVRRGEPLEVAHLFAGFKSHGNKLITLGGLSLLFTLLMVLVVALIFGPSTAFMLLSGQLPGAEDIGTMLTSGLLAILVVLALSLPWYMALYFAAPLIVLADAEVVPALRASFFACLKNVVPFLVWSLAFLVLAILASIPLALGWLLLGPVAFASIYLSYRDIFYEA